MMKTALSLIFCCVALLNAAQSESKLPEAAAVLDRFVEVTGGVEAYQKIQFERVRMMMFLPGGVKLASVTMRARDGRSETVIETTQPTRNGITNGIVWEINPSTGARILSGEREKAELAKHRSMEADSWRDEYPQVQTIGEETIDGKDCYHIKLTRTDASTADQYYDKQTGLLVREEEASNGGGTIIDIDGWQKSKGITYMSAAHTTLPGAKLPVAVVKAEFLSETPSDVLLLPKEIEELRKANAPNALPNAADLIDRFITVTGGAEAHAAVKTQIVKSTMMFKAQNMTAQVLAKTAMGGRSYLSMDLPGAGLFEFGSDGKTRWQRSTLQGPQLSTQNMGSGLFGPSAADILSWKGAFEKLATVSKEQVEGRPCYFVKMKSHRGDSDSDACFDVETGYLVKVDTFTTVNENKIALPLILKDYRSEGGIKLPHIVDLQVAGQAVTLTLTQVINNPAIPDNTFDLPDDIKALVDAKAKSSAK